MFDHNQKWFYPDGTHPNQTAFNQLYSFLINQGIVAP
jgi:hypothetical protein